VITSAVLGRALPEREGDTMPKTSKQGDAKQSELPSTLQRSPKKAQRTYAKAHDSALDEYGDEKRANQVAWAAVKHSFEKVGDHWERKDGGKRGPSDAQASAGRNTDRKTKGGVDANATKTHLLDVAKKLDISGRTKMKKRELVDAIKKASDRKTAAARKK
jgi:cation transport regulator ChaB